MLFENPSLGVPGTDQERRSFDFFCHDTGRQLAYALNIQLVHQLVLQMSHFDITVRSAIIALGSMGERLRINSTLTLENDQANICHHFAQTHYYKAVRHLRTQICTAHEHAKNAIIPCFLFTVFEFLQGNDAGGLLHLRSGLKLLRQEHGSLSTGLQTMSPAHDSLRYEIARIFSIMDVQATLWLGLESFQGPVMIPLFGPGLGQFKSDTFISLKEAADSLNKQSTLIYYFRHSLATFEGSESQDQMPLEMLAEQERLIKRLESWNTAVDILTAELGMAVDVETLHRVAVMKMNYITILIELTACTQYSKDGIYSGFETEFRQVISLASFVIRPFTDEKKLALQRLVAANNGDIDPAQMFSFGSSTIKPLYLVAAKCQNLSLCREAIDLLASSPWREGAWDSATMARIAERRVKELEQRTKYLAPLA